jgi:hypothetical protein
MLNNYIDHKTLYLYHKTVHKYRFTIYAIYYKGRIYLWQLYLTEQELVK